MGGEWSPVTINGVDTDWFSQHLQISWVHEESGGWFVGVERHERYGERDFVFSTSGYRRLGDWTIGGGMAATEDADFWFRRSATGELSRRIAGTVVASGGYCYFLFPSATVHQAQPALTWYHHRGELQGRVFITYNSTRTSTSLTGLLQSSLRISPRIRIWGAVARGDRIFDIQSLAAGTADAWVVRGTLRVGISRRFAVDVGGGYAREEPGFEQRTVAVSLRSNF